MMYYTLLVLSMTRDSLSLKAYDCAEEKTRYSEISLKDIGPCAEVGKNYQDPTSKFVQVIKKIRSSNFKSKFCKVKINLDILHCGWDGKLSSTPIHILYIAFVPILSYSRQVSTPTLTKEKY